MSSDVVPVLPTGFTGKLRYLFAVVPRSDGTLWTGKDVAAAARARGVDLSESYLSELKRGIKANPTLEVLNGLAEVFEVHAAFFLDHPAEVQATTYALALRAATLEPEVSELLAVVTRHVVSRRVG